jgi:hypothetical protein
VNSFIGSEANRTLESTQRLKDNVEGGVIWRGMPTHFARISFSVWVTVTLTYKLLSGIQLGVYLTAGGGSDENNT